MSCAQKTRATLDNVAHLSQAPQAHGTVGSTTCLCGWPLTVPGQDLCVNPDCWVSDSGGSNSLKSIVQSLCERTDGFESLDFDEYDDLDLDKLVDQLRLYWSEQPDLTPDVANLLDELDQTLQSGDDEVAEICLNCGWRGITEYCPECDEPMPTMLEETYDDYP